MNIGIIGFGKMGEAITKGLLEEKGYKIYYYEKEERRVEQIAAKYARIEYLNIASLIDKSDAILLAVKPQDIKALLMEIDALLKTDKLFISICAGISTPFIQSYLTKARIIKAMPNMGALVGKSFTTLAKGESAAEKDLDVARNIFATVGNVKEISEDLMDSITAISGSGPAYFAYFLKALEEAASEIGLSDISDKIAMDVSIATLSILRDMGLSPDELIAKVASPGGTTEACLDFWNQNEFSELVKQGIKKARRRAKELGQ